MRTILVASVLLIAGGAFAQDSRKQNDPDAIKTATAAEVKARADQGAAAIHELPYVKEEVEKERALTEKTATAGKASSRSLQNAKKTSQTKPSSATRVEDQKVTSKKK